MSRDQVDNGLTKWNGMQKTCLGGKQTEFDWINLRMTTGMPLLIVTESQGPSARSHHPELGMGTGDNTECKYKPGLLTES